MTTGQKSLTDPPTNLKEAIDWVIKIKELSAIYDLAAALDALLKSDFDDVARPGEETDEKIVKTYKDGSVSLKTSLPSLADILKKFLGPPSSSDQGIIKSNGTSSYTFAYNGTQWNAEEASECAVILLATSPILYLGLGYVQSKCSHAKSPKQGWKDMKIKDSAFGHFLTGMGFPEVVLNGEKQGSDINSQLSGFTELQRYNVLPNEHPYNFFKELHKKVLDSTPPDSPSPLTSLYALSYYYITNFLYIVEPTIPAAPSFLSYSGLTALAGGAYGFNLGGLGTFRNGHCNVVYHGVPGGSDVIMFVVVTLIQGYPLTHLSQPLFDRPSNLKEAIDWILRVTGKDGGQPNVECAKQLAKAITDFPGFRDAIETAAKKLKESGSDDVSKALQKLQHYTTLGQIIGKLAEGLKAFIGYERGTIKYGSKGIGLPNDPRERLGDAVLGFIATVLKTMNLSNYKINLGVSGDLADAMKFLTESIGGGVYAFDSAVKKAGKLLKSVTARDISDVWRELKTVDGLVDATDLPTIKAYITVRQWTPKLKQYFNAVLDKLKTAKGVDSPTAQGQAQSSVESLKSSLDAFLTQLASQETNRPFNFSQEIVDGQKGLKQQLDAVVQANNALSHVVFTQTSDPARYIVSAVVLGIKSFLSHLQKIHYTSYYQGVAMETSGWSGNSSKDGQTCAKIFLGCIPVIFSALSYLYWRCDLTHGNGKWNDMPLRGGQNNKDDLKDFLYSMAYGSSILSVGTTGNVVSTALQKFEDFKAALSTSRKSYPEFIKELKRACRDKLCGPDFLASSTDHSMTILYSTATLYFTGKQIQGANNAEASPSTIREMLYFLAALPFSSEVGELEKHIGNLLSKPLLVSIAGINTTKPLFLTANNINSHLTTTVCLSATTMLGRFQGPGYVGKDKDPFLHNLYSNGIGLRYPSGAALFRCLTGCTYAVQFQLNFLLQQCSGKYIDTCGWRDCRFGSSINGDSFQSHLCPTIVSCSDQRCDHAGKKQSTINCNHHASNDAKCGSNPGQPSPLQAFLTDKLTGFCVSQPSNPDSPNHLHNHTIGSMCHKPMGFANHLRKDSDSKGAHIGATLRFTCANAGSPFRRICDYLLCLSKNTPKTLGEFFGFYWQIVTVTERYSVLTHILAYITDTFLQNNDKLQFIAAMSAMNGTISSHYAVLRKHDPRADLMSLYYPECQSETCGPYLKPLSYSTGSVFSHKYASTYLSWLVYLADDFRDWMSELLERFDGLKCDTSW
ncbi:variant erythrocyte surface antigen-1 family protein [Babesia caballi]|uniref:Variant erythrocyte surface antigen-1 family protein n=1 Tax=Babesia caballi TaxID=5871 RepID=A0AAV4LXJ9_BABCB|nr:variant erythrocyte surface antigen-1 family protein [Babesia caballi]